MPETIHVRGEGGQVIAMDLPLPEPIQQRLTSGYLRRVNPDGSPYTRTAAAVQGQAEERGSAVTEGRTPRPAPTARKAEWVGWAVAVHGLDPDDAEAMTKADLTDLPEHPAPADPEGGGPAPAAADRPSEDAPKSEWIQHVVKRGQLSADDAANYTKADLIEMSG
ncbi:hypothetical protein ACFXOS_19700 [Streptomyces sp. NPDC059175]|uniref:hypothetical protein n=1 Tax=Streptomyces sp. NPDC059175 TaxID=3346757 RepID=UPI0036BF7814